MDADINSKTEKVSIEKPSDPSIFVIFGASGDLTKRLLIPSIYNIAAYNALPEKFAVIGLAKDEMNDQSFKDKVAQDLKEFGKRQFEESLFNTMSQNFYYMTADFANQSVYTQIKEKIEQIDKLWSCKASVTFYLAVSPAIFEMVTNHLAEAGFAKMDGRITRIILEKPFGHDYQSAVALNESLHKHWDESQIWRIDHYLGKETVQNLLAFRFGNGIFEPIWNRNYVQHVQITVAEEVGVELRGEYYDKSGALRDMFQNHILQVLSYLCMEAPSSFSAETIRNCKVEVLKSITPMSEEEVKKYAVRGQYNTGEVQGKKTVAYREEAHVDKNSSTETFIALKLFVDNWRWSGVPFYVRTGKHLKEKTAKIIVHFKRAPKKLFTFIESDEVHSNELRFYLQPKQAISLILKAKVPGSRMMLKPVNMFFDFQESFDAKEAGAATGYEVLIYDIFKNDPTLFSRSDLIEQAWRITEPVLSYWAKEPPHDFPNYTAGSWGPDASTRLIEDDGHHWRD